MKRGTTFIIQGGQWGSEGKGQIAAFEAQRRGIRHVVRTGSINAGHTVYYNGRRHVMQILPTAWILPGTKLILGAGCYIQPDILKAEIDAINAALGEDIRERIYIDTRCAWFGIEEQERAKKANRHHAMGATGKGASEAIISKMRDRGDLHAAKERIFANVKDMFPFVERICFCDTSRLLNSVLTAGEPVLIEGTQGSLLDFHTGPYPYVTSRATSSAGWLSEAGLPPTNVETILVCRTYPIRVAGNSGPMPMETTWPQLAREVNINLESRGLPARVSEKAIQAYESSLETVMRRDFAEVVADVGDMFLSKPQYFSAKQRERHRVALSEAYSRAFVELSPDVQDALAFFEKTTVTKKLRRVARLEVSCLQEAIRYNDPTEIVVTFLNYEFPHLWGNLDPQHIASEASDYIARLQRETGLRVTAVSTGPLQEEVLGLNGSHG